jgi:hypothetical protein
MMMLCCLRCRDERTPTQYYVRRPCECPDFSANVVQLKRDRSEWAVIMSSTTNSLCNILQLSEGIQDPPLPRVLFFVARNEGYIELFLVMPEQDPEYG